MKKILIKILLIFLFFSISIFITSDVGLIEIEKTALVTALGIDYDKERDMVAVTAQIAIPQETATSTSNDDSVITGYGKTIGSAVENIALTTGWYPKLSFCNLVIIHQDIVNDRIAELINYILYSAKIYDSLLVSASVQPAKDVLNSYTPLDNVSSFALLKILLKNPGKTSNVYYTKAKDIAIDASNQSKSILMPLIDIEQHGDKGKESNDSNTQETKQNLKDVVLNATKTLLIKDEKVVGTFSQENTLFFNLLTKNVGEIYYSISYDDTKVLLKAIDSKRKIKITPNKNGAKLKINLELKSYLVDIYKNGELYKTQTPKILSKEIKAQAEKYLKENITSLIDIMLKSNCDFLKVNDYLYKFHNNFYKNNKKDFLQDLQVEITTKVTTPDKKLADTNL